MFVTRYILGDHGLNICPPNAYYPWKNKEKNTSSHSRGLRIQIKIMRVNPEARYRKTIIGQEMFYLFPKKLLRKFFIYTVLEKRMQSNKCVIRNVSRLKTLPEKTSISRKSDVLGSLMS